MIKGAMIMGMFDSINCNYPLPITVPEWVGKNFQTKDLLRQMRTYEITVDGRLIEVDEDSPKWNINNADLEFYDYRKTGDILEGYEFIASFVGGKLIDIKLKKHEYTNLSLEQV